jgi:hypothetical protein
MKKSRHHSFTLNPVLLCAALCTALVLACGTQATPTADSPTATTEPAAASPSPSPETITATTGPTNLVLDSVDPATVAFDFIARRCEAEWVNSGENLPCNGDLTDIGAGYAGLEVNSSLEGNFTVNAEALLTIPGHTGTFTAIFGQYPAFTVQYGDSFRAVLACQQDPGPCDVGFDLMYYDDQGTFHEFPGFGPPPYDVDDSSTGGYLFVDLSLNSLAGETVEFILGARDGDGAEGSRALWIRPYIYRDPDYIPPTLTPEPEIPGVFSGMVDMGAAPPYLKDPVVNPQGRPVVVMFFNQDDYTWWWVHTTATHPNFQMTVTPGDYLIVAYAMGVGEVEYVTAGYTGMNPSCNQPLQRVNMPSNGFVEGIVIADWNWNCGGTAYRPAKPAEVPIP